MFAVPTGVNEPEGFSGIDAFLYDFSQQAADIIMLEMRYLFLPTINLGCRISVHGSI